MKFASIYSNSITIASLLMALGIIYRDIGTKS
jgi:K+ transporter